ncbi:MAG: hypothetical protein B6D45_08495, partial [Ignavibacteriales bacterium UTCHB3]
MKQIFFFLLLTSFLFAQGPLGLEYSHPKPFPMSLYWAKYMDANTLYAVGSGGVFMKSTNNGQNWSINYNAGVPSGGAITYIVNKAQFFDKDKGFLTGTGGVTYTGDGGATFQNRSGSFTSSVAGYDLYFTDELNGYIVGTSSVKLSRTTDGGSTWVTNATLPATTYYALQYFSANHIIVAGSTNASANVRVTTDGGATWTASAAGTGTIYDIEFIDANTGYACGAAGGFFKTTDGGATWTTINTGLTSGLRAIIIKAPNEIYVTGDAWELLKTTDAGATVSRVPFNTPSPDWAGTSQYLTIEGNKMFIAGSVGANYFSPDAGATWQTNSKTQKIGVIQTVHGYHPAGTIVAVGQSSSAATGQHVLYSNNWGATWNTANIPDFSKDLRGVHMINGSKGFAVGSGGNIYRTLNGGAAWDSVFNIGIQALSRVSFYDENLGIAVGNAGNIWKTSDGGNTWVNRSVNGQNASWGAIEFVDANTVFVSGSRTVLLKSTDAGESFTVISVNFPTTQPSGGIKMADSLHGYIVGSVGLSGQGYVWSTSDGGLTWGPTGFPAQFQNVQNYSVVTRGANEVYVSGQVGAIYRSTDAGATWTGYGTGLITNIFSLWLAHPDTIYAASGVAGNAATVFKIPLPTIIPVELASFTADVNGNTVFLNWKTATETNNSGFYVER